MRLEPSSDRLGISYLIAAEIETVLGDRVDKLAEYPGAPALTENEMKEYDLSARRKPLHRPLVLSVGENDWDHLL